MTDFVYVTIYNKGQIPWLNNTIGPVFGMYVGAGVYQFLARDPRVSIKVTTPEEAKKEEAAYLASLKKDEKKVEEPKVEEAPVEKEEVVVEENVTEAPVEEPVPAPEAPVEEKPLTVDEQVEVAEAVAEAEGLKPSDDDAEIDAILAEDKVETYDGVDAAITDLLSQPKKYERSELEKMTKKKLAKILESRGYKASTKAFEQSSEFAPKYHDTVADLVEKVLKTQ